MHAEVSPDYHACVGGNSENYTTSRDCAGGGSKNGIINRALNKMWPQNTVILLFGMCASVTS